MTPSLSNTDKKKVVRKKAWAVLYRSRIFNHNNGYENQPTVFSTKADADYFLTICNDPSKVIQCEIVYKVKKRA